MKIGDKKLKNEFIMAPIKTGYSDNEGKVKDKHLAFYKKRAKSVGAIIPEPFYLDKSLREIPTQMGIDSDDKIEGLNRLTNAIQKEGAKVIAHLNHPGRMANPKLPGNRYYSSTDKACENGGAKPEKLDKTGINNIIELFKDVAVRAEKSNFDIIELQFGHGYLAAQFLSPNVNDRNDEYGGSLENRMRFPREIFKAVKKIIDLPIIIRISGDEMTKNGIKLFEMKEFARVLQQDGADAIHVSAGTVCSTPPWYFQHMFIPKGKTWEMAKEIKDVVDIPVIAVGKINEAKDIKKIKKAKMADYMAIGRQLVADPDFITKISKEESSPIRPCLACTAGCLGGVKSGQGLQCLVNPDTGREAETINNAEEIKKYAIVGGGLAGMEAAITLKNRGHKVTLFEKNKLGGQFNLATLPPHKQSMSKVIDYYKEKLEMDDIEVKFEKPSEEKLINNFEGVIIATGSKPAVPSIPGLDQVKYYWAEIMKEENIPQGKNVFIIGGGLIGVDIATALIENNNKVTIVKRTTDFGEDMEAITKTLSLNMMRKHDVVFSDNTTIQKIEDDTVYAVRNGEAVKFENIDIYVVSTGMKSYYPYSKDLEEKLPVYTVGDAREPADAHKAISATHEIVKKL